MTLIEYFSTGQGTSTTGSCASSSGGASGGGGAASGRRTVSSSSRVHKGGTQTGSGIQAQIQPPPPALLPAPQSTRVMAADQPLADVPNSGLSGKFRNYVLESQLTVLYVFGFIIYS